MNVQSTVLPVSLVLGGLFVGFIFEKVILVRLKKIVERTKWKGDEAVLNSFKGLIFWGFTILGMYGALLNIPLSENISLLFQRILVAVGVFLVTWALARLLAELIRLYSAKVSEILPSTTIFSTLSQIFVFLIGILIVLQTFGISITPILTALGVGGLAVALALQDTLSNLFSGLYISISRQIKIDDYIKLDTGEEGYITDITWRNTIIRELPNNRIIIPNAKLASANIRNYHLPQTEMSVLVEVGVSYGSDLEKVERITIETAKSILETVDGGVADFNPFIRYHSFSDFSIDFSVILRCKEFTDQYLIKHEFIKKLHLRYDEEKIKIPFPTRTIYLDH